MSDDAPEGARTVAAGHGPGRAGRRRGPSHPQGRGWSLGLHRVPPRPPPRRRQGRGKRHPARSRGRRGGWLAAGGFDPAPPESSVGREGGQRVGELEKRVRCLTVSTRSNNNRERRERRERERADSPPSTPPPQSLTLSSAFSCASWLHRLVRSRMTARCDTSRGAAAASPLALSRPASRDLILAIDFFRVTSLSLSCCTRVDTAAGGGIGRWWSHE